MTSRFSDNKDAGIIRVPGSEPLMPENPLLPALRQALTSEIVAATGTLFSARGPYPVNENAARPFAGIKPAQTSEDYFIAFSLCSLWDERTRQNRLKGHFDMIGAYMRDLITIPQRQQGNIYGNFLSGTFTLECTPGSIHSVYKTIAEERCPRLQPMQRHMERITSLIESMNASPSLLC